MIRIHIFRNTCTSNFFCQGSQVIPLIKNVCYLITIWWSGQVFCYNWVAFFSNKSIKSKPFTYTGTCKQIFWNKIFSAPNNGFVVFFRQLTCTQIQVSFSDQQFSFIHLLISFLASRKSEVFHQAFLGEGICFHTLSKDLPFVLYHTQLTKTKSGWGAYATFPWRRCPNLVKVFEADPLSKLFLVLSSPHLHGWCIWAYYLDAESGP